LRLCIDERCRGGDSPPGDFEHKITSPEAIILLFPSEIQQFLQNCWRALNERPYKIIVGFRLFCACVSMNAVGAAIPVPPVLVFKSYPCHLVGGDAHIAPKKGPASHPRADEGIGPYMFC